MLYEFCAENFERVPAAIDAGAKRIELCDNLAVGGTTPSAGVISTTVSYAHEHDARVMCMIRPRGGDFHYNQDELRMMEMDLGLAVSAGVDGLVFGCCKPCAGGWALDELTLGALVMATGCATEECKRGAIDITFHMAFDQLSPEAHQRLERVAFQQGAEHGAVAPATVAGLGHHCGRCLPDGLGQHYVLLGDGTAEPVVHTGGIVGLAPEIGEGHAEGPCQLLLLLLRGRLAAGFKLFDGQAGQSQRRRQRGAAEALFRPKCFDPLCHSYHDGMIPPYT